MKVARPARRCARVDAIVSMVAIVGALAAWLAAGGEGSHVPEDRSAASASAVPEHSSAEDRAARLLAGLPGAKEPRAGQVRPGYAKRIAHAFARFEARVGAPMQAWSADALAQGPGDTVFYPFAGADFPTARRLYPQASRYVLVAMQRGGPPPRPGSLGREGLRELMVSYERLLADFLRRGYFVTAEMNDATGGEAAVRGVTGLLMAFAAREGFEVVAVEPVQVDDDGVVRLHPGDRAYDSTWESVRLRLRRRADGRPVLLEYLRVGLSNFTLKPDSPPLALVTDLTDARVILKAASHLPQDANFTTLTDLLLRRAPTIVQDETGVAYDALTAGFAVELHGEFRRVNELFEADDQATLLAAYRDLGASRPLPFHVGYRKGVPACLLVATRAGTGPGVAR